MKYWEKQKHFNEEIVHLISLRQEGGYWDFKKQWHETKTDLLHDIICMANNLHNHTAYIIIGIDEENDYAVVDVKADSNRKNTQKIVDFLKDKKFAGGIRPLVHVEQLHLCPGDIDIIVIENSHNTPFYLTERFEGICANHIYTRVMDTNTPKDKSADINNAEYLWRKRFYLDETPIEKLCFYLKNPSDWKVIPDKDSGHFYKYAPEYTITCEKDDVADSYEYYMLGQLDSTPNWYTITLRYHQTTIERFQGLSLDGGRCFVVAPCRANDFLVFGISNFGFFIQNSLRFRLLEFYHHKETYEEYSYTNYMNTVAIFASEQEYWGFLDYVQSYRERYNELFAQAGKKRLPHFPERDGYNMDVYTSQYQNALALKDMLNEFRSADIAMEEKQRLQLE